MSDQAVSDKHAGNTRLDLFRSFVKNPDDWQGLSPELLKGLLDDFSDIVGGGPIVSAPQYVIDTIRLANRVVSFVLDNSVHFGTGILVGPAHVLSVAHLFLDEHGDLIDDSRISRTTVEVHTMLLGNIMGSIPPRSVALAAASSAGALIDPSLNGALPRRRDVDKFDFAIVRLKEPVGGDDIGGSQKRGWITLPTADTAPLLVADMPVHVLQYIDAKELRISAGVLRPLLPDGFRVPHTASTVDGASGSPLFNEKGELVAIHASGVMSGVLPRANYALPVGLIAGVIDAPHDGKTVRSLLTS